MEPGVGLPALPSLWGAGRLLFVSRRSGSPGPQGRCCWPVCALIIITDTNQGTFLVINMQKQIKSSSPVISENSYFHKKSALHTCSNLSLSPGKRVSMNIESW